MSFKPIWRCVGNLVLFALAVLALQVELGSANAQMMVCQTQYFWCSFPGNAPSNLQCYCNTYYGPIYGYSINPNEFARQPQESPIPQERQPQESRPGRDTEPIPQEEIILDEEAEDCLNGLGNCDGTFLGAVRRGR
jgi:hypothetical protein